MLFWYLVIVCFVIFDLYLIFKCIEYFWCAIIKKQPPMCHTSIKTRQLLAQLIHTQYKKAKTVYDMGSGYGGLIRYIAQNTNKTVYGIENMLFSVLVSRFFNIFYKRKTITIWDNVFHFLDENNNKLDIVIAYLNPESTQKLINYKKHFKVLITVDFDIKQLKPVKIIKIKGFTRYYEKMYPHRLFIYEL